MKTLKVLKKKDENLQNNKNYINLDENLFAEAQDINS